MRSDFTSIQKLLAPIRQRIALLLMRGVGHMTNSATALQTMQIELLKGDVLDNVEHLESYGFTAHPLSGHEVLAAAFTGNRCHSAVIATPDRRYRKNNLVAGEVALYTDEGDYIILKRGRIVEVVAGTRVRVTAPDVEVIGNIAVTGTLTVSGAILSNTSIADPAGTLAEARGYYNGHSHPGGVVTPQMT